MESQVEWPGLLTFEVVTPPFLVVYILWTLGCRYLGKKLAISAISVFGTPQKATIRFSYIHLGYVIFNSNLQVKM